MCSKRIGLIGLGAMGSALGHNWQKYLTQKSYPPLTYWNRTISKGDELKQLGAEPADSAADLAKKCDVVFFALSGDQLMKDLLDSMKDSLEGKILCDMSTVHPDTNTYVQTFANDNGASYVASPMFGASTVAWNKGIVLAPSGKLGDFEVLEEYLKAVSKAIMYLGEDVQKSAVMKITANIFVTGMMELIGEVQSFGDANGIPASKMTEWAEIFGGPTMGLYFKKNSAGLYYPGKKGPPPVFSMDNAAKDMKYAKNLAAAKGFTLPIAEIMSEHMEEACKLKGTRNMDGAAVYGLLRTKAGLEFENEAVIEREK